MIRKNRTKFGVMVSPMEQIASKTDLHVTRKRSLF